MKLEKELPHNGGDLIAEGHGRGTKYYLPIVDANIGCNVGSNPISKPKKMISSVEIREAIISVSAECFFLDYIATKIDRTTAYLLSDIIPKMFEEGLIERMYPDSPGNPYKKYKRT